MAELLLLHHIRGLTPGVRELGERWRQAGHTVHTPDLFDGELPASLEEGFALKDRIGDDAVQARLDRALDELSRGDGPLVLGGISWGVALVQPVARTRPGVAGAVLLEACLPLTGDWGIGPWPEDRPVQVHGMQDDEFFGHEGDLEAAQELVASLPEGVGELVVHPGSAHLFTDSSLPSSDPAATDLVVERVTALLGRLDHG